MPHLRNQSCPKADSRVHFAPSWGGRQRQTAHAEFLKMWACDFLFKFLLRSANFRPFLAQTGQVSAHPWPHELERVLHSSAQAQKVLHCLARRRKSCTLWPQAGRRFILGFPSAQTSCTVRSRHKTNPVLSGLMAKSCVPLDHTLLTQRRKVTYPLPPSWAGSPRQTVRSGLMKILPCDFL